MLIPAMGVIKSENNCVPLFLIWTLLPPTHLPLLSLPVLGISGWDVLDVDYFPRDLHERENLLNGFYLVAKIGCKDWLSCQEPIRIYLPLTYSVTS